MDVAVFSEAATPKSTRKKASSSSERLDSSRKLLGTGSISRNNTPRRQNEKNNSPVSSRRSTRKRSTGSRGKTKRRKRSNGDQGVVTTTTYQLPQFTDNEIDWTNMSPPQSKFQLTRTPVKKITNEMDDKSRGEVREDNKKSDNDSEVVTAAVNISHVINDQHVTSSIDPAVTDHVVVDNEVTIVTGNITDNDDGSNIVPISTEHSEVIQTSSNISILIPSYKEDAAFLPATLRCTDNDLAYLERMANIKVLKELTHKGSLLDKELKSAKQEVEEILYKCQTADEEYNSLCATNKRTAIMVHHFLNNKHLDTIPEVCTEELQAAGDVTLDKETTKQLQQAHKELKIQLQTANRALERKKAMLEKQKEQNKETVEKTAALQAEKEQLMTKLKEMDQQEDKLREHITSIEQQQQLEDKNYEEQNRYFKRQLEILKERCELYKQREKNMKQISDYMDGLELRTKLRQNKVYQIL